MTPSIVAVLAIGGLLGLRHAFEPDHLAAVSTLATRPGARLWSAVRVGLAWGLGHTATVGVVALVIVVLGIRVPERFWPVAELVVAGLLILLGTAVIWRYLRGRWHMHVHAHIGSAPHYHLHSHAADSSHRHTHVSLGFGIAHGLAGSGTIAALLIAAAPDAGSRLAYFAAFGLGTIFGMVGVSLMLSYAVRLAARQGARWATSLHVGAAIGSVVAGLALIF